MMEPLVIVNINFNPFSVESGVSECITATRRLGELEWATGLREPVHYPQSVRGAGWYVCLSYYNMCESPLHCMGGHYVALESIH